MMDKLRALALHLDFNSHACIGHLSRREQLVSDLVLQDLHALLVQNYLTELARRQRTRMPPFHHVGQNAIVCRLLINERHLS